MSQLEEEIEQNFRNFHSGWQKQQSTNIATLEKSPLLAQSYQRLTALQGLRERIVIPNYSKGSADFFLEAQNDALISHVNASVGSWRAALQSLRGVIENALSAIYYKDHPVEYSLWENDSFRIGAAALRTYVSKHPSISPHETKLKIVDAIEHEYATLSKAVHASTASFRMTAADTGISLWTGEKSKLGMWSTRHKKVVESITLLFATLHADKLQGTSNSNLRSVIYFALSKSKISAIKSELNITISAP